MVKETNGNGANLGFEQKLWQAADKMRSNMDAAEYKHVVLGLIFLKYISDSFEAVFNKFNVSPNECVVVGDSFEKDLVIPQEMGALTVYVGKNPSEGKKADYSITSLYFLKDILSEV